MEGGIGEDGGAGEDSKRIQGSDYYTKINKKLMEEGLEVKSPLGTALVNCSVFSFILFLQRSVNVLRKGDIFIDLSSMGKAITKIVYKSHHFPLTPDIVIEKISVEVEKRVLGLCAAVRLLSL